jgi:hypothetical protein
VEYAAYFSAADVENPYPLFTGKGQHETAMARIMQLFSHLQHNLIPLGIQHVPISVYATQDDSHQLVSLLFVNKSSTTQIAQISSRDQFALVSPWHDQTITLAGGSIVEVTLHRGSPPETYATAHSFLVPANNDPTISPLTYTVCGHKTDALAADIPC